MLEGMHKRTACQPPYGSRPSPSHHPQTSGCTRWNSLHLCKDEVKGMIKGHNAMKSQQVSHNANAFPGLIWRVAPCYVSSDDRSL